jgi:hypothetical protein
MKLETEFRLGAKFFLKLEKEDTPEDLMPNTPSMANTQVEAASRETSMIFFMFLCFKFDKMLFGIIQI